MTSAGPSLKYRAFLSYSHADSGTAKRVHRRLEGFHIDKELIGRETPQGAIPKTLQPIFRDRNDFDAGASLGSQTSSTLDDSAALCGPDSLARPCKNLSLSRRCTSNTSGFKQFNGSAARLTSEHKFGRIAVSHLLIRFVASSVDRHDSFGPKRGH
jgi:hypothetical protein